MNAYWMNELLYKGTECPAWLAWTLIGLVGAMIVGVVVAIILVNKN